MKNEIFERVLHEYSIIEPRFSKNKKWVDMSEDELWQELCLCILSSNVPYELALSAFIHLKKIGYLNLKWISITPNAEGIIAKELSKALYFPRKNDGTYRKYRFPNMRARNIFESSKVILHEENWLFKQLENSSFEEEARNVLVENISGIGLKQASHYLRNIKYANRLAIIDSHILAFLKRIKAINDFDTLTQKNYLQLEKKIQKISDQHGLDLSIFDLAIWKCMRSINK